MRSVIDSAERAGQPPRGLERDALADALRRAQQAHLRASLQLDGAAVSLETLADLRRHATYLDRIATRVGPDQGADALFVVGTIYEWLARLQPAEAMGWELAALTRGRTGDLIRSSMAYAGGRHEASSALAGRRALVAFDADAPQLSPLVQAAARLMLQVLARDFAACLRTYPDYAAAVRDYVNGDVAGGVPEEDVGLIAETAEGCARTAAAMLIGEETLFEAAATQFASAEAKSLDAGAIDVAALVSRMGVAVRAIAQRSTFRLLRGAAVADNEVRWYASRTPELWSNQAQAIAEGFLDPSRSFLLSVPTGSGKTFLAQLRILATLNEYPDSWVAYLAPTRALVREVHRELAAALRPHDVRVQKVVAGAEAAVFSDEEEVPILTAARSCVVLTPERLDLYMRAEPSLAATCRLVVVDEVHEIAASERGPRLEALIATLLSRWPEARVVALSAFVSNALELAGWLGDESAHLRSTDRPTRELRGVCVRYNSTPSPDLLIHRVGVRNQASRTAIPGARLVARHTDVTNHVVGAILASSPSELTTRVIGLPGLATVTTWREQRVGQTRRKPGNTGLTKLVADILSRLASHPGLVMAFLPATSWTRSTAKEVSSQLGVKAGMEPYVEAAARVLGRDDDLVQVLRSGCAFYNSRLPEECQRIVEAAARAGVLEVLCTTSGLQAGVNLPASIVVVVGDPEPSGSIRPTYRDFANMAGRAGRPYHDTEGTTLYVSPTLASSGAFPTGWRRYLLPDEDDIAVESALTDELLAVIESADPVPLAQMSERLQAVLLGLWANEIRNEDQVSQFVASTLDGPNHGPDAPRRLAAALTEAAGERPTTFDAYSKTALPYVTCRELEGLVPSILTEAVEHDWHGDHGLQARIVATALREIPFFELRISRALGTASPVLGDLIEGWVRGDSYDNLRQVLEERGATASVRSKLVSALTDLGGLLGWASGSLLAIARRTEIELPGLDGMLPYFIRFGTNDAIAAYLRLLGITDRDGASLIAAEYPTGREVTFQAVAEWTRSAEARRAIREVYADSRVLQLTIEGDLGLAEAEDAPMLVPVQLTGDWPLWVRPGGLLWLAGENLLDPVAGLTTPLMSPAPVEGLFAITGKDADSVVGWTIQPPTP